MKNLKIMLIVLLVTANLNAMSWSTLTALSWDKVKPVKYQVETAGVNIRTYEWKSKVNPNIIYATTWGNDNGKFQMTAINTKCQ